MGNVLEQGGRLRADVAAALPEGLFERAEGMDGLAGGKLYRMDTLEDGAVLKAVFVDAELDDFVVEFYRDEAPKIHTGNMAYLQPEVETLLKICDLDAKAQEFYRSGDVFLRDWNALIDLECDEKPDLAAIKAKEDAMQKRYRTTLGRWRKVR